LYLALDLERQGQGPGQLLDVDLVNVKIDASFLAALQRQHGLAGDLAAVEVRVDLRQDELLIPQIPVRPCILQRDLVDLQAAGARITRGVDRQRLQLAVDIGAGRELAGQRIGRTELRR